MTAAPADINTQLAALFRPRVKLPCLEWVRRNVWLDRRFTDREGYYDPTFNPYIIPLHEWYGDPEVRTITCPKGAQLGITTFAANTMQWSICENPGPILFLTSTSDIASAWSDREWRPRINSCKPLRALIPADKDAIKKLDQNFFTCTVTLRGAQSENNIATMPVRSLYADECDKWPRGFLGQAEARTLSYRKFKLDKITRISTTTDEEGPIWVNYTPSTQHEVHVFCPNCKHSQIPDFFTHIKWPKHQDLLGKWDLEAVMRTTYGQCENCGIHWPLDQQRSILSTCHAIQTNPHADPAHRGLRLPSVLSPFLNWGELAAIFLTKKDQPGGLQDFHNNYLAKPYSHNIASIKEDKLLALRGDHRLHTCPFDPILVTLCADPGEKQTHWSVEARQRDGTTAVLDYGTVLAPEDLLKIAQRTYPITGTDKHAHIHTGLIDSGYSTERIYALCAASGGKLLPSKGSTAAFGTWTTFRPTGYDHLTGYTYVDFTAKCSLYIEAIAKRLPPLLIWPADVGHDFIDGHAGQEMREKRTDRGTIKYWRPLPNDHFGDCSKLHRIAWWILGGAAAETSPANDKEA